MSKKEDVERAIKIGRLENEVRLLREKWEVRLNKVQNLAEWRKRCLETCKYDETSEDGISAHGYDIGFLNGLVTAIEIMNGSDDDETD